MDEKPFQLLNDAHEAIPMKQGKPERGDFEYLRNGTCGVFIFTEPLFGWRHAKALPRWTKVDWAHRIRWLLDGQYPEAEKVVLVMDNLNNPYSILPLRCVSAWRNWSQKGLTGSLKPPMCALSLKGFTHWLCNVFDVTTYSPKSFHR